MEALIGFLILCALGFASFHIMENKGRSGVLGVFLGVFLGIFGLIICLLFPKADTHK